MNKKALLPGVFVPLMLGFGALTSTLGHPSMEHVRAVDITALVAAGTCFGAALVTLVMVVRRKL